MATSNDNHHLRNRERSIGILEPARLLSSDRCNNHLLSFSFSLLLLYPRRKRRRRRRTSLKSFRPVFAIMLVMVRVHLIGYRLDVIVGGDRLSSRRQRPVHHRSGHHGAYCSDSSRCDCRYRQAGTGPGINSPRLVPPPPFPHLRP